MMGQQKNERELFSYAINLEKRVRSDHPLRRVAAAIDFGFVREAVAHCYGSKGNVSVDPEVIMKMMFLLFFDDVASERELMKILAERLDYLWFLGYGLEDEIPDHSVLSKARARWGEEVFEGLFVQTIGQCVEAGLESLHGVGLFMASSWGRVLYTFLHQGGEFESELLCTILYPRSGDHLCHRSILSPAEEFAYLP